jgi:endoglucanase
MSLTRKPSMTHPKWALHDLEYLHNHQTSFFAFHNQYPEGKQAGVEIIHHNERIASCGFLKIILDSGEERWCSSLIERKVNSSAGQIEISSGIKQPEFSYGLKIKALGDGIRMTLSFDKPLSSIKAQGAFFNLDFYPPLLWGQTLVMDKTHSIFPRDLVDPVSTISDKRAVKPMAAGRNLTICPDNPLLRLNIKSSSIFSLYDIRYWADQEWFSLRCPVPVDKQGKVLTWDFTPSFIPGWMKKPMIAVSQVGYHPNQPKQAIIELDPAWNDTASVTLQKLDQEEGFIKALTAKPKEWGTWLRYKYSIFDFSSVTKAGIYRIEYKGILTDAFRIAPDVYAQGVWQPTLNGYFPVQMCHMEVWDRGRLWHAACHMDDAMQVPSPFHYKDGYNQGPNPDTPYKPFEHVPHVNKGGWHDAGDTDIAAGSQIATTYVLGLSHEEFGIDIDETTVIKDKKLVKMHEPDGIPDILQQIEHGVESILGGYRAVGHSFCGIIESIPQRYYQADEVSAMTDNRIYDPNLKEDQVDGNRSGLKDDRFVFTNRDSGLEYAAAAVLALSSRLLKGYNDSLADECIKTAEQAWANEQKLEPVRQKTTYVPGDLTETKVKAAVDLYLSTKKQSYLDALVKHLPDIIKSIGNCAWVITRVLSHITDKEFKDEIQSAIKALSLDQHKKLAKNPFGISYTESIWGIGWHLQDLCVKQYYLQKTWPHLFDKELIYRIVNWILGCHPGNNVSLVSGVGAKSLTIAFGINRADFSYIPGGAASGVALIKPDFHELKTDSPFFWQQSEYVMSGAATYLFSVLAADRLIKVKKK